VTCYSNSGVADAMTARLKGAVGRWRSIVGLTDEDAAAMILADGIDILVDLSGHTANNRLPLFALKPAPVQVTWLGYSGTTGLSTIDYILADNVVAPKGGEAAFSETVWRLPGCYLCYSPPALDIAVGPFPALTNGFVTFGCFNSRTKISAETLAVWAAILRRVEGSRLFLKSKSFADESCRKALEAAFAEHGIESDRLTLMAYLPQGEALDAYNKVDIALDPFPYGGTTTTAEMLWMGVPLVALGEGRWVTRVSRSILATLGLDAWVAKDADDYIEIACRLAADLHNLAPLRADLRGRVESSALCDGPRFTRSLEEAYRGMWIKWCAGRGGEER
jgi:predicted O-linked N-acetylglucosamine transferase (SPINDLY family)